MKFNKIKCWSIRSLIYDLPQITSEAPDLELIKKSILKNGYRAFCLNDREEIETSEWFTDHLLGVRAYFYIDGSGIYRLSNIDLTENEFYFEKDNMPVGYKPYVFYSWQSDFNQARNHIRDGINRVIAEVNENRNPNKPLELIESTRPEDGAEDILLAIKKNIDHSLIAVFDITNVASIPQNGDNVKCYPNANVVFELSYALQRKRSDQIIIVKKNRNDLPSNEVPFDFRQNLNLNYDQPAQLRTSLMQIVLEQLERIGFIPQLVA